MQTAAIEEAFQCDGVIWTRRTARSKLAAGEEAKRQRSPDSTDSVYWYSTDRIVDAQVFKKLDACNYDNSCYASQKIAPVGVTQ